MNETRKTRVLHIGKYLPPVPGGIETYLGDLLRVSMRHGLEVAAVVHHKKGHVNPRSDDFDGAKIYSASSFGELLYAPIAPTFPFLLRQAVKSFCPDILHVHLPNASAFWVLPVISTLNVPLILHWHADVDPHGERRLFKLAFRLLYRRLERALAVRAKRIICTSQSYLQCSVALKDFYSKCTVVRLGLDLTALSLNKISINDFTEATSAWPTSVGPRILVVARLVPYKGISTLMHALDLCRVGSVVIVGNGAERRNLQQLATQLNIDNRVRFVGEVSSDFRDRLYRAADVVCVPSLDRREAFGLTLAEAVLFGKAVIYSKIPGSGVQEVAQLANWSLAFAPGNHFSLAAALSKYNQHFLAEGNNPMYRNTVATRELDLSLIVTEKVMPLYKECLS